MASYPAPTETLPTFAPAVFNVNNVPLTIEEGSKYFITYPTAQGAITIPTLNTGTLSVSGTVGITNTSTKATVYGYQTSIPTGSGEHNSAFGYQAGKTFSTLTTTGGNSAFGALSLQTIGVGATNNTAIGHNSLYGLTSGSRNTFVGVAQQTGNLTTTETDNTTLGYDAKCAVGVSNSSAIGTSALATSSNQLVLGKSATPPDICYYGGITPLYTTIPTYTSANIGFSQGASITYPLLTTNTIASYTAPAGTWIVNVSLNFTSTTSLNVINVLNAGTTVGIVLRNGFGSDWYAGSIITRVLTGTAVLSLVPLAAGSTGGADAGAAGQFVRFIRIA